MHKKLEDKLKNVVSEATQSASREEWSEIQDESSVPIFNYRFDHVEQVVKLTEFLARHSCADSKILTIAAWLHDIAKPGIKGSNKHGKESAKIARNMLSEMDIDDSVIERVCDVIKKHVGLFLDKPLRPLEAQILWEADKLAKLGATGIIHWIINSIRINPGLLLAGFLNEFEDYLSLAKRIGDSMHTEAAKRIAKRRLETLIQFKQALKKELDPIQ